MRKRLMVWMLALIVGATGIAVMPANAASRLTTEQRKELKYIIEEEKLARDVYTYLAENVTTQKFANIAKSEQTHMDQIAALLVTYKIKNPTTGNAPGEFENADLQKLYDQLIVQGAESVAAAMAVGVLIEETDIADLVKSLKMKFPADVNLVLNKLLNGSKNHLAAFNR